MLFLRIEVKVAEYATLASIVGDDSDIIAYLVLVRIALEKLNGLLTATLGAEYAGVL